MKAWTYVYNPFVLGGNVNQPVGIEVDNPEIVELGKGFYGFVITSPNGKTFVVETESGGIVGAKLEDVRKDIEEGDIEVMRKQVEKFSQENVKIISEEEFWSKFR